MFDSPLVTTAVSETTGPANRRTRGILLALAATAFLIASGFLGLDAAADSPEPAQAMDDHPIYDAIEAKEIGPETLATTMTEDTDQNGATDFLDLWAEEARAIDEGETPIEVLAWWNGDPSQEDVDAFQLATDAHHAESLDLLDAIFATVPPDRAHDALALQDLKLLVWQPRLWAQTHDPSHGEHNRVIDADEAHTDGFTGEGSTVAVLDTGIDGEHPAFTNAGAHACTEKVVDFRNFVPGTSDRQPDCGFDDNGHGTHVSSTVAGFEEGNFTGVAPDANLVGLKILDAGGGGAISWMDNAIQYITDPNSDAPEVDVASMSAGAAVPPFGLTPLNGGETDVFGFDRLAEPLAESDIPFTTSAGNVVPFFDIFVDATEYPPVGVNGVNQVGSPAFGPDTIAVGALTAYSAKASYSAVGPGPTGALEEAGGHEAELVKPNVMAMGTRVWGALANDDGYHQLSGTSMAAPAVAGTIAILQEKNANLSAKEAQAAVEDSAQQGRIFPWMEATQKPDPDFQYGHGLARVDDALGLVDAPQVAFDNVTASIIKDRSALITWETNNNVDAIVKYGTNGTFSEEVNASDLAREHSLEITGLEPETTYNVRVACSDGSGCPATGPTINLTTLSEGQISTQAVDVFAHDVIVRTESGSTTFGDQPFDLDTRFPEGEPDNENGTFYVFPGPLGANSWEMKLDPPLEKSLSLNASRTAEATFHISPRIYASCIIGCIGALPVNVTATVYSGNEEIGSGSQEKILVDNNTRRLEVTTFRIPLDLEQGVVPDTDDVRVIYQWETPRAITLNELIRLHGGENFPIKLQLPLENPVAVDRINVTELPDGNHEISADVASPFGDYDLNTSVQEIEIRDENGTLVNATLVSQPEDYTWLWDNQNDDVTNGTFEVKVGAASIQGAEGARTTTFVMDAESVDNLPPKISDAFAYPDAVKNNGINTTVLTAEVTDSDGTVENVTANLTEIGGDNETAMVDDGSGADETADDDVYTVETTVATTTDLVDLSLPVEATDNGGATSTAAIDLTVLDGLAPTAPDPIEILALEDGTLFVNWTEAEDEPEDGVGVDHYDVYRKAEDEGAFQLIDESESTELRDVDVRTEVNYTYRVSAVDANENVGPAVEATAMPLVRPTVDLEAPAEGETVTDAFNVTGTARIPDSAVAVPVPKVLGSDAVGDTDASEGAVDRGLLDITELSATDTGDEVIFKVTFDELGEPAQNGDVFYAATFDVGGRQLATSTHIAWAAGHPVTDDNIWLNFPGRTEVDSDTNVNVVADTLTFELSKQGSDLATDELLEDIQVRTYPTADLGAGPISVGLLSSSDEATGDDYTIAAQPANRLDDAEGDSIFTTSADIVGLEVSDAGDDIRVRMDLQNTLYLDAVNGDTIYGVFFEDAETGADYATFARVQWAAGQPVRVEDDPLLVPASRGTLTGSTNELDDANGALTFTLSKEALGLASGIESVAGATWLNAGIFILPEDKAPNAQDNVGRRFPLSTFGHSFATEPGEDLFDDESGDVSPLDSDLKGRILDLRNGTVHGVADDIVVRLSLESLRSAISSNGEAVYHVGFDVGDERFTADTRVFWVGSRPIVDSTFSLSGARDAAPTAEVNVLNGTLALSIPKTSNGFDPGANVTNVTEETYASSTALQTADTADGANYTLVRESPPGLAVETSFDGGAFEQVQVERIENHVIHWRQTYDGAALDTGNHTVDAQATDASNRTSDVESVTFDINHAPNTELVVDPFPTGVGATSTLDASGTTDDRNLVEVWIDPGDGTGPVNVTDGLVLEHTYAEAGTYTVTVAATDDGATATTSTDVAAHTVYNLDQGTWHPTIQAAIDEASTGDTILVQPGTYEEALAVDVPGLTVCQANAATDGCASAPDPADVVVDASAADSTVAVVLADDVTLRGMQLRWEGSLEEDVRGVRADGSGTLLERIAVHLPARGCDPVDACQGPSTAAVEAQAATTVREAQLHAQPVSETQAGTWGVLSRTWETVRVEETSARNWTIGVHARSPDTLVRDVTFETDFTGVQLAADDAAVHGSTFAAANSAVYIAGGSTVTQTNVTVRDNELSLTRHSLLFQADKANAEVDARLNHWGVLGEETILEARVEGEEDNQVEVVPYLDTAGEARPPLPQVYCFGGDGLELVTDTLSLQEALDLDLPDGCVSGDDDTDVERVVRLAEFNAEPYKGATIATESFVVSAPRTMDSPWIDYVFGFCPYGYSVTCGDEPGGAAIEAGGSEPVLRLTAGADDSVIDGVTLATSGSAAVDVDGLSPHASPAVQDTDILADPQTPAPGIQARDGGAPDVINARIVDADPAVLFTNTSWAEVLDSRIRQRSDALGETEGVRLEDANRTVVKRNSIYANGYAGSTGVRTHASITPIIEANVVRSAGLGVYATATEAPRILDNIVLASPTDQFGEDTFGVSLFRSDDAVTENNLFSGVGTGLALTDGSGLDSNLDRAIAVPTGFDLSAVEGEPGDAADIEIHNASLNSTLTPLHLDDTSTQLDVDAACNDWGAYTRDTIEARISDDGENNTVDIDPWTSLDADQEGLACLLPPDPAFHIDEPEPPITRLDTVHFNETSEEGSRPITEWRYDFGDGNRHNASATDDEEARNPEHSYDMVGTFDVVLEVEDTDGQRARAVKAVTVENIVPTITSVPDAITELHTSPITFDVAVEDAEGDPLRLSAELANGTGLPGNATFTDHGNGTATFAYEPDPHEHGTYVLNVTASDPYDTVLHQVELEVVNEPPVFDPALPETLGGAENRTLTLDVLSHDPDAEDEVEQLSANLTELPNNATFDQTSTSNGTLSWTPTSNDSGTYNITFAAESPAHRTVSTVVLDIRKENAPPTIEILPDDPVATDGTTAKIEATANDSDGPLNPVGWAYVTSPDVEGDQLHVDGNTALWEWEVPAGHTGEVEITFDADDGLGAVSTNKTLRIETRPYVDPRLPLETETDTFTRKPIVGSTLNLTFWSGDPDGALSASDLTVYRDSANTSLSVEPLDRDNLWMAQTSFMETGLKTVTYEATDADGHTVTQNLTFRIQDNDPPSVDVDEEEISVDAEGLNGATVPLSGDAFDPEGRTLSDDAFTWKLPDSIPGDTLTGAETEATVPVGSHEIVLAVEDPFGGVGTATVVVEVDDFIEGVGELEARAEGDHYRVDMVNSSFGKLSGWFNVTDDQGSGVAAAEILGTVTYHGTRLNEVGVTTATFANTTDSEGVYEFRYEQEILGAEPTSEEYSFLSAPGWHEISLYAASNSREEAPAGEDLEETTTRILYWVEPSAASQASASELASPTCHDGEVKAHLVEAACPSVDLLDELPVTRTPSLDGLRIREEGACLLPQPRPPDAARRSLEGIGWLLEDCPPEGS